MPFTVAETPASLVGSGRDEAISSAGASCDPKIAMIMPGAYTWRHEAALLKLSIVGGPAGRGATVKMMDPDAALYESSPLYCAVIVLFPIGNCDPFTATAAAEFDTAAAPSAVLPAENVTVPVGVPPLSPFTVAVRIALLEVMMTLSLADRVKEELPRIREPPAVFQAVTRL